MAEREVGTYREGDLVRVTNNDTGEGFQARVRAHDTSYGDGPELFLSSEWNEDWREWTFLNWWTHQKKYTMELVEAAEESPPTRSGWYLDGYGRAFRFKAFDNLLWWGNSEPITEKELRGPYEILKLDDE